jgi:hypothetical protein
MSLESGRNLRLYREGVKAPLLDPKPLISHGDVMSRRWPVRYDPGMEIVNGVPCYSCADVAKAKAGLLTPSGKQALAPPPPPPPPPDDVRGINQPLAEGPRGTQINLAI